MLVSTDDNYTFNYMASVLKKNYENVSIINYSTYFLDNGLRATENYVRDFIAIKEIGLTMIFIFAGELDLSVKYFQSLKEKTKIVFWFFDDEQYFHSITKYYAQTADVIVTTDYFSRFAYEQIGKSAVFFLSKVFYSIEDYFPVNIKKTIDVSFMGDCRKSDRMEILDYLIKHGINVQVFGIGSMNGFVELEKTSEIFSASKINLNLTKLCKPNWVNHDDPIIEGVRGYKGRPFEIAMTRSFCLSEYSPSLERLFEKGKEIDFFRTKEELLEKVRYYLINEDEREGIANNVYEKLIGLYDNNTDFKKVFDEIHSLLEKDKGTLKADTIYLNHAFKTKHINCLTCSMLVLISRKKICHALALFPDMLQYGLFIFLIGFAKGIYRAASRLLQR